MGRKRTKKYRIYIVTDLLNPLNVTICYSISDVAGHINIDRRTIDLSKENVYKHHLVLERDA